MIASPRIAERAEPLRGNARYLHRLRVKESPAGPRDAYEELIALGKFRE